MKRHCCPVKVPDDYEAVKALGIANPEAYDFKKILEW